MKMPQPGKSVRILTIVVAAYGAIWIALEGSLFRVTLLASAIALVALLRAVLRRWGGRVFTLPAWAALWAGAGLLLGFGANLLTLVLMAVKSGLHAHGWEYELEAIDTVLTRTPAWSISGLMAGMGLALLLAGLGYFRTTSGK